jgi:hypothetical protein
MSISPFLLKTWPRPLPACSNARLTMQGSQVITIIEPQNIYDVKKKHPRHDLAPSKDTEVHVYS